MMGSTGLQSSLFEWVRVRTDAPRGVLDATTVPADLDIELGHLLHRALEERMGTVDLILTDNRRRMVSIRKRRSRHEVRLHHMFLGCDTTMVDALVGLSRSDAGSRDNVRDFIRDNREAIRIREEGFVLESLGKFHDLDAHLAAARMEMPGAPEVRITWGRDGKGRRSIRFGSYDFEQRLIRIHPALDADWVPDFFVLFVVCHELLHSLFPPSANASRRSLHPAEFREREQKFPTYAEAIAWETANLRRLLNR
jgi:hypothetical protein